MIRRDYLIVGAGIGGVSVCEGIREHDKKGTILLAGNETAPPYHRPRLFTSLLGKRQAPPDQVLIHDAAWFEKNHIELRLDTLVTQINLERHIAVLANGQAIEFRKACMAMGSRARRPQVAGGNLGNVFYLRTLRDVQALREVADLQHEIAVVGGGFIALETAALLSQLPKARVTLLHRAPHLWSRYLGPDLGAWLAEYYADQGVKLMLNQSISGFEGRTVLKNIATKSGDRVPAGLAIVALGAEPNLGLVAGTPLAYPHGTPVNEYLETDEKGIFAVGDIASYPDKVFGGVRRVEHWPCAVEQGHVAGANMSGKKRVRFEYMPHFSSTVFDLHFDFVGDFSKPATLLEIEGDRAKKKFAVRHFVLGHLTGVVFCNKPPENIEAAKKELRDWPRGKKAVVQE
jgi:3-phenylpropionate/trans-cinnamate dioxygenase ferredoxin reductase subunit